MKKACLLARSRAGDIISRSPVSVFFLTYNEELNIERGLQSVKDWAGEIIIVDSGSTDRTLAICAKYTDKIYYHAFENHGKQVNWALQNVPFQNEWVFQLDADERVTPELAAEIQEKLATLPQEVTGVYMKRRMYFLDRWIKHGGYYPMWLLRLFRNGKAVNEEFEEDRVLLTEGTSVKFKHDFIDHNLRGLIYWTEKHTGWVANEARDITAQFSNKDEQVSSVVLEPKLFGTPDQRRRWLKKNVYGRSPRFLRAFAFWFYRYVILLGFLDGKEGFVFHFLHACWYRFIVDAKVFENRKYGTSAPLYNGAPARPLVESAAERPHLEKKA